MSSSTLEEPHSESYWDKTEALLAFRTISTMLSLIQSQDVSAADGGSKLRNSRKELLILNALAAIAIREHGVAAVVAAPYTGLGDSQVLISVSYPNHDVDKAPKIVDSRMEVPERLKTLVDKGSALLKIFLEYDW